MPTPAFRQYIWLVHEASPVLFAAVGNNANISFTNQEGIPKSGRARDPGTFIEAFLNDRFIATSNDGRANTAKLDRFNLKPHFFTINGQSGHFAHNHATITPMHRVGEPCLIRIINAGLWTHSMHIHANHVYVTSVDNVPQENPLWVDVFMLHPMGHMDYTLPYMRPPDVPNVGGFGRGGSGNNAMLTLANPPFPGFPGAVSPGLAARGRVYSASPQDRHHQEGLPGRHGGHCPAAIAPVLPHAQPFGAGPDHPGRQLQHRPDLGDVFHRRPERTRNFPIDEDFMICCIWAAAPAPPDRRQEKSLDPGGGNQNH